MYIPQNFIVIGGWAYAQLDPDTLLRAPVKGTVVGWQEAEPARIDPDFCTPTEFFTLKVIEQTLELLPVLNDLNTTEVITR